jgi:hypothetical protein
MVAVVRMGREFGDTKLEASVGRALEWARPISPPSVIC